MVVGEDGSDIGAAASSVPSARGRSERQQAPPPPSPPLTTSAPPPHATQGHGAVFMLWRCNDPPPFPPTPRATVGHCLEHQVAVPPQRRAHHGQTVSCRHPRSTAFDGRSVFFTSWGQWPRTGPVAAPHHPPLFLSLPPTFFSLPLARPLALSHRPGPGPGRRRRGPRAWLARRGAGRPRHSCRRPRRTPPGP